MTPRETIWKLRERIRLGKARKGDRAQLATLERQVESAYSMPCGQCRPVPIIELSAWGPRKKSSV